MWKWLILKVATILGNLAYLKNIFLNIAPQHPHPPEAVVLCLKERLIPWVFVGSNVELGGKGSSLRKAADLEIVLLCEVAGVNGKKNDLKLFCPGL